MFHGKNVSRAHLRARARRGGGLRSGGLARRVCGGPPTRPATPLRLIAVTFAFNGLVVFDQALEALSGVGGELTAQFKAGKDL